MVMATYTFNPTDYQIPSGLNFQVAKDILSVVFEKLRTHLTGTPRYEQLRDEIIRNAGSKKFEIKLNNVLGKQNPSSSSGGAGTFLTRYFPGEDLATRQSDFSNLPSGFIAGVGDGVRLKFTTTTNHAIIAIVADNKSKGVAEQDLYHLTMPLSPDTFPDSRKHFTIHFTDESTGQHDYYRFDDLRTLVLSEGGGSGSTLSTSARTASSGQSVPRRGMPKTTLGQKKPGGKRRSTRRRRALRKTRKAYI
jgi:hypothetical protein